MWQMDMLSVVLSEIACLCCWMLQLLGLLTMTVMIDLLSFDVAGVVSNLVHFVTSVLGMKYITGLVGICMAFRPGHPPFPHIKSCCPCWCAECPAPRITVVCFARDRANAFIHSVVLSVLSVLLDTRLLLPPLLTIILCLTMVWPGMM